MANITQVKKSSSKLKSVLMRFSPWKLGAMLLVVIVILSFAFDLVLKKETSDSSQLSIEELQTLGKQADNAALIRLGQLYLQGEQVPLNPHLALEYLEQAALNKDSEAQYLLGMLLFNGFKPNKEQIRNLQVRLTQQAQGLSSKEAKVSVNDLRIVLDRQSAVSWLEQAALQGHVKAQVQMGEICKKGIVLPQSYHVAFKWFKLAAEQGNMEAQFILAEMLAKGQGTRNNMEQALFWYKLAAEQGHAQALYVLARFYERGRNVTQDYAKAQEYYGLACDNGLQKGCSQYRKLNLRSKK